MKKQHVCILLIAMFIIAIPIRISAVSRTTTRNEDDGTVYNLKVNYPSTYKNLTLYELYLEVEAITFGTLEGVIVAFYDIKIYITFSGDTYFHNDSVTLSDINSEGGISSITRSYNLSDIADDSFVLATSFSFKGENTQGEDPSYGLIWIPGIIGVRKANTAIIVPILAVLCLTYFIQEKRRR